VEAGRGEAGRPPSRRGRVGHGGSALLPTSPRSSGPGCAASSSSCPALSRRGAAGGADGRPDLDLLRMVVGDGAPIGGCAGPTPRSARGVPWADASNGGSGRQTGRSVPLPVPRCGEKTEKGDAKLPLCCVALLGQYAVRIA
jgi:hypothetical protein